MDTQTNSSNSIQPFIKPPAYRNTHSSQTQTQPQPSEKSTMADMEDRLKNLALNNSCNVI